MKRSAVALLVTISAETIPQSVLARADEIIE
jgi:hypothetical protein